MKLDRAATAALLRELEAGRRQPPVLEDLDLEGAYTWKRGVAGATFRRVRLAWTTIKPGLLGRRPSFSDWTIEECRFESVLARRADFVDVSARGLLLSGPFEAFADCRFTDCVLEDLTIPSSLRFENCSFVNVRMAVASPDNLVFVRCLFERSAMSGSGTVSFVDCRFRDADLSGLDIWNSALNASGEADARLPKTRDCFFVPAAALEGPLAELRASISHPRLRVHLETILEEAELVSAKEIRRLGGHGPEAERVLEAFWPYRIGNLAEAAGPPVRRPD